MDKLIGILLGLVASVIHLLACPAVSALAVDPRMRNGLILHMAFLVVKVADTVRTVGPFAAIERAATQQRGKFGQGNAKHLTVHDVVNALLTVGNGFGQATVKPLDYLTKKYARLAERVEKGGCRTAEQLLRKQVEHLVGLGWRREYLIVAEVGDAVQHIGIVRVILHKPVH